MLYSYINQGAGLAPLPKSEDLAQAIWIDLYHPTDEQVAAVAALGYDIPTLADMEEIEISNRLYTDNGTTYMTGVLPGQMPDGTSTAMPVTFILNARRLVTVRHHNPRPFETFPTRADRSSCGTSSAERIFLGLIEEITGRLADLSEGVSKVLDTEATEVLSMTTTRSADRLEEALVTVARQAELVNRIRVGLLSLDRILVYQVANTAHGPDSARLRPLHAALQRDIQALEEHANFLSGRIGMAVDATMGMIGLLQNDRVRSLSVVAALFLPPTLIASIYGMNFQHMPVLALEWGFPMALGMMVLSVIVTLLILRWMKWY